MILNDNDETGDFLQVELEIDDASEEELNEVKSPFDPKLIKIIVEPKTIDHLVQRLLYDEIDLNTEFQRKGNLWNPDAQSRLIESILLRFPLPAFYFDAEDENKWLVVDGLQRLWTLKNFIVDSLNSEGVASLKLTGLDILTEYNGQCVTFRGLTRAMQRRILETPITTYLIQPGTPKDVKYNIFRRINTGGLGLNSMEIRNALNQGKPSDFLKSLSEDEDLKKMLRIQDRRMEDRELYLRAIAFMLKKPESYSAPLSGFLDKSMEELWHLKDTALEDLSNRIKSAIRLQIALFGRDIFSRSVDKRYKMKLNSALFEVWVSELSLLTKEEQDNLVNLREKLISNYISLIDEDDFSKAISTSTSGYAAVNLRFNRVRRLIKQTLI